MKELWILGSWSARNGPMLVQRWVHPVALLVITATVLAVPTDWTGAAYMPIALSKGETESALSASLEVLRV